MAATVYLGAMSGTSLDGIDVVAVETDAGGSPRTLGHLHRPLDGALREALLGLGRGGGSDELHRAALAANVLADAYAAAASALLATVGRRAGDVVAFGAHGQTVRHRPRPGVDGVSGDTGSGYTVQLLNGARLAEALGVDVVCDFRARDVAAGGHGAPLVPAFHAARFAEPGRDVAVANVGGIANVTLLAADGAVAGFDTGPGNMLLDGWCARHLGQPFDDAGAWAASGRVDDALLARLLAEPYFALPPPKSTGRELFDVAWLDARLAGHARAAAGTTGAARALAPADVQATLLALTARTLAEALRVRLPDVRRLSVCGGGARNDALMRALAGALPGVAVESTAARGVDPSHVEALAFAWLAQAFVERRPGNIPAVTGACGPRVLGALHPAR